jgi:hypothetical protein
MLTLTLRPRAGCPQVDSVDLAPPRTALSVAIDGPGRNPRQDRARRSRADPDPLLWRCG